jgi:hypothetical protein
MGKCNNSVNIRELIDNTVKITIKEFNKEQKKEARNHVFHNTKLLMENYISLKEHMLKSISNLNDAKAIKSGNKNIDDVINRDDYETPREYINDEKEMGELIDADELYIRSIEKSKFRTFIMVTHIDVALNLLKKKAYKEEKENEYQAFICHYIYGETYETIQGKFHVGEATPSRWMNHMCRELSVFLFGIDGLKFQ